MTNEKVIREIMEMNSWQLLSYVLDYPENLTDPYYREFSAAINKRFEELRVLRAG